MFNRLKYLPALLAALLLATASPVSAQSATEAESASEATVRKAGDYASMMDAMNNVSGRIKDYNAVTGKTPDDFQVVDARTVVPASDLEAFQQSVVENDHYVSYLRNVSGKIALIKKALDGSKVAPESVVALDVLPDDTVVIYYDGGPAASGEASDDTAAEGAAAASDHN